MISFVKKLLAKSLGLKAYLKVISRGYFILYRLGFLNEKYPENHLIQRFVKKGDYVIDLGANLGYYTIPLSQLVGPDGKVWAVEPIPIFNEVLEANKSQSPNPQNIIQFPYAMGDEDEQVITMQIPVQDGMIRHGLSAVQRESAKGVEYKTYQVTSYNPATLFKDVEKVDFIKCDVEGYEGHVIPHLKSLIAANKPILQVEIGSVENRELIYNMLEPLGYTIYGLQYPNLLKGANVINEAVSDFYFVPENRLSAFEKDIGLAIKAV